MTGPLVLDASVAASWCFSDEKAVRTEELKQIAHTTYVLVPAIFPFELQNILWTGERRQRISAEDAARCWRHLSEIDVRVDPAPFVKNEPVLLHISRAHGLTVYDAAYLELASRSGLPLATLDDRLRAVAKASGVVLAL